MKKFFSFCLLNIILLFSHANDQCSDARIFMDKFGKKAIEALTNPSISDNERANRFHKLLNEGFDVPSIGKFVMGVYWKKMTAEQKQVYLKIFEERLVATYANRFKEYLGVVLEIKTAKASYDNCIIVESIIKQTDQQPVIVNWKVFKSANEFKILDVIIDGISMSISQRDEFLSSIQENGGNIDKFLIKLKNKNLANS